ncbi:hypothetical protein ACJMK2_021468 [Sinanodonta woodiana]|uniref:Serine/threonine-protein kinase receptor n=1 Tax=Sinanodonta woodiana TaxID=1069815 RepID=A0ABD3TG63_SINWO
MVPKLIRPLSFPILCLLVHLCGGLTSTADAVPESQSSVNICEYYNPKECNPEVQTCKTTAECSTEQELVEPYCYAAWKNDSVSGFQIISKGCWTDKEGCNQTKCLQLPKIDKLQFCCCKGHLCNQDVHNNDDKPTTLASVITDNSPGVKPVDQDQLTKTLICSIVPIVGLAALVVVIFWMWKRFRHQMYEYHEQLPTADPTLNIPSEPNPLLHPLKLIELRARGRFGAVWKAQLMEDIVAVKIFPLQDRQSWMTEQDIYGLPHMDHDNILKFIAVERRGDNLNIELWLITEFHPRGSLCDYLKGNTLTWSDLCKIAETMATGLAHLHDEVVAARGVGVKPAVAHRDFKSKNVLLKNNLTACVADFGLALKFEPGKSPGDTHGQVGTRRYMAPEVLEGAISFNRDAFLRIDMYACGLVLWELISRCDAVEGPVSDYQLPYEEEVGTHPTLEDMQELVVINKARPAIKELWLKHPGLEGVISTMEECWDHDAEARLSAGCVQERIMQLSRNVNISQSNQQTPLIMNTSPLIP